MAYSFADARKAAEEQGLLSSGGFYKFKEGDNRIRLMSECVPHTSVFKDGNKSFKWLCYVIDRRDGAVKPFFMPHTIYKNIEALQANPDYAFEDVPMPYDITVHAKGAGTKEVEYTLLPARKESPLTADEREALAKQKPIRDVHAAIKEKQAADSKPAADEPPHPADGLDTPF